MRAAISSAVSSILGVRRRNSARVLSMSGVTEERKCLKLLVYGAAALRMAIKAAEVTMAWASMASATSANKRSSMV